MIFLLKDLITGDKITLSERKEYIVGRKNCDILLENDQSISRKHAVIRVKDDHVTLEDCKSKYHTLYNEVQISPEVEIRLKHMDSIQFGMFNSKFCFESYTFITAASALSPKEKLAVKENIAKCKGKYVDKWSNHCTHLTVDKITLTIKVLQALIDEKPIVTPLYWAEYAKSIEEKTPPPDINKFNKPPVAEQLLRSDFEYKPDPGRKSLFNNKMFVFLNSTVKKQMEDVIKSCGGDCMAWEEAPKTFYEINKSPKEHLIIKTDNDEENVSFSALIKEITKQKKRPIPLNEIALAIVNCSCEINCNPDFNKVKEVFESRTQKQQTMGILAAETQSEDMVPRVSGIKTEKVIPPTLEEDWANSYPIANYEQEEKAGSSGGKRMGDDQDKDDVKKPRIEEDENKGNNKEKLTKIEDMRPVARKSEINNKAEDSYVKSKPQPSQKRKAEEDLDKTDSKKLNPFSLLKPTIHQKNKSSEEENPFELTRTSSKPSLSLKRSPSNEENPFARISSANKRRHNVDTVEEVEQEIFRPKREPKKEITLIPNKSDIPSFSSLKRSFLNSTWMSKSSRTVKKEVKEEDSELLKISEAFKNCVKVEVLSMYNRKEQSIESLNNTSVDSVDGKRNFKKFKKVRPFKPQVTIIPRNQFTKIAPGDTIGIEINDCNDSDDEAGPSNASVSKPKAKPRVKKFLL